MNLRSLWDAVTILLALIVIFGGPAFLVWMVVDTIRDVRWWHERGERSPPRTGPWTPPERRC